jgi:hypothetical protein
LHGLAICHGIDILFVGFVGIEPVKTAGGGEFRQFLDRDIVGEELGLL